MRKLFPILAMCALVLFGCKKFDDTDLWKAINENSKKIAQLEIQCKQVNTDVQNITTIVNAYQSGDVITAVNPLADGSGYTITFSKSGTIVIKNGEPGSSPQLSVDKYSDGLYYWKINGEWLKDEMGNMIIAQGKNGGGGTDGVTPQFKIQDGYWYVSYDKGKEWEKLGPSIVDSEDSGSTINVKIEGGKVYFIFNDGTTIILPIGTVVVKEGTINFEDDFVRDICLMNFDSDGDGYISFEEAAAVTDIGQLFTTIIYEVDATYKSLVSMGNHGIRKFNELQYFTGLQTLSSTAFSDDVNLHEVIVPEGVTSIATGSSISVYDPRYGYDTIPHKYGAFSRTTLSYISLPSTLTSIGNYTFKNATIQKCYCYAETPPTGYSETGIEHISTLYVPQESVDSYKAAKYWSDIADIQEIQ